MMKVKPFNEALAVAQSGLTLAEVNVLIPVAMKAVSDEIADMNAHRYPPNPVKATEYIAHERARFEKKVARLNELLSVWLENKIEIIAP
jgi:hypothetical protein